MEFTEDRRSITDPGFDEINNSRGPVILGEVDPVLDELFSTEGEITQEQLRAVLDQLERGDRTDEEQRLYEGGLLFSYIEAFYNSVPKNVIRCIMTHTPALLSHEVAHPLLNSNNRAAIEEMESMGFVVDENLAKTMYCNILDVFQVDNEGKKDEQQETYTPIVMYLMSKGLGHIINPNVFVHARTYVYPHGVDIEAD